MINKSPPSIKAEGPAIPPDASAGPAVERVTARGSAILSVEEERRLVQAWQQDGDLKARDRLVTAHLSICQGLARKLDRTGRHIDDLVQEGVIALMMVADKFDLSRSNRFSTYAAWWVRARMQDFLAGGAGSSMGMTGTPRKLAILAQSARIKAYKEMMAEGCEPDPHAVNLRAAEILKVKPRVICDLETVRRAVSLNTPTSGSIIGGDELIDHIRTNEDGPEATIINREVEAIVHFLVDEILNALTPREAEVIRRRLLYETRADTLNDVAADLGVTRERARQIQVKAIEKILRFMEKRPDYMEKLSLINTGYTRIMRLRKLAKKASEAE